MSQLHLNQFSQKGCIGCKSCERGSAHIGRMSLLWTIGILTAGMGLIFVPFFKKCQYCGHNTALNKHYGVDPRQAQAQMHHHWTGDPQASESRFQP